MFYLSLLPLDVREGRVRLSAEIESSLLGQRELWFDFPQTLHEALTHWADPFVLATVQLAMQENADIYVRGRVSPSRAHRGAALPDLHRALP